MKTFSITDIGQYRKKNQDYFFTSEIPVGNLPNLFIVADGMGGHNAGEYASKYTVDTIVEQIQQSISLEPVAIIEEAVKEANKRLVEKAEEEETLRGMGTTVVISTLVGEKLYAANVGDSRLYIIHYGIEQITRDHSLVEEMVRLGEMDRETARAHPDKNIITRVVGVTKDISVDFFERVMGEDEQILMCSDGLTNMVEDEDIRRILNGQRDIAEKAEKLVEAANRNGGKDNITVVVIEPFSDEVKEC